MYTTIVVHSIGFLDAAVGLSDVELVGRQLGFDALELLALRLDRVVELRLGAASQPREHVFPIHRYPASAARRKS